MTLPDKAALLRKVRRYRDGWDRAPKPAREPVGAGEESVWDFPRPPAVEPVAARVRVIFAGVEIADTTCALRVVETAGAPVYHVPPADTRTDLLVATGRVTVCEWKGAATYYDIVVGDRRAREAAYAYPDPLDDLGRGFAAIAGWYALYPGRVDEAWVGDKPVEPQPGGYYAGWVTPDLRGPIKGTPGTEGW